MKRMNWIMFFGTMGAIASIAVLIAQQLASQKDKEEIIKELVDVKGELGDVKHERNELRVDLEKRDARIDEQTQEIIHLNRQLVEKSDKLTDFVTGGNGYPIINISPIHQGSSTDGSFRFEVRNDTKLPLYSVKVFITDIEIFESHLKKDAEGNLVITTADEQKAIVYTFNHIEDITPGTGVLSGQEFQNPNGLYSIKIKSLNSFVFEKLAIVPHNNVAYWGYSVFRDDKNHLRTHFSPGTPEDVKGKIQERLEKINFGLKYRLIN